MIDYVPNQEHWSASQWLMITVSNLVGSLGCNARNPGIKHLQMPVFSRGYFLGVSTGIKSGNFSGLRPGHFSFSRSPFSVVSGSASSWSRTGIHLSGDWRTSSSSDVIIRYFLSKARMSCPCEHGHARGSSPAYFFVGHSFFFSSPSIVFFGSGSCW